MPMPTFDLFIMMIIVNRYLLNDIESSLRISTKDFSSVANSSLFEGNVLRFRALAQLKLFENSLEHQESESYEDLSSKEENLKLLI